MTQLSGFWTTNSGTSATGHQQASYTQAQWSTAVAVLSACCGFEGVASGYLNELACSDGGTDTVDVATGGAVVDGKWYKNDATINQALTRPAGGYSRIDRLVLRADWAGFDVTLTVIVGTAVTGTPVAPSITQTSGTTYDILLCQALIDDAGAVTVTDERVFAAAGTDGIANAAITNIKLDTRGALSIMGRSVNSGGVVADITAGSDGGVLRRSGTTLGFGEIATAGIADSAIATAKIADDAVTAAKIADGAIDAAAKLVDSVVTAAKIANRTRKLFVPAQQSDSQNGVTLPDAVTTSALGQFTVPSDFVSGMTIEAVVYSTEQSGDLYCYHTVNYGAVSEGIGTHSATSSYSAIAITATQLIEIKSLSLSSAAAGDYITVLFQANRSNVNDTISGDLVYILGFIVEYTADS